jgi:hypothetical protein
MLLVKNKCFVILIELWPDKYSAYHFLSDRTCVMNAVFELFVVQNVQTENKKILFFCLQFRYFFNKIEQKTFKNYV